MRTRLAVYGLAIADGDVLLAQIADHEPDAGYWTLPGGGVEWGEHPEDALQRELYEETGLEATIDGLFGIRSHTWAPGAQQSSQTALHTIQFVFAVSCSGTPRVTEVGGSVQASRWVPLATVGELPSVDLVDYAVTASLR